MKTLVEFESDKFPPYEGEEAEINPDLWGKRLAEYLRDRLPDYGLTVTGIGAEDWGWRVELENDDFPLWIGCGHRNDGPDAFLCFIEPSKPNIRKWFKKIDTSTRVAYAVDALKQLIESDSDIHAIEWP